MKEDFETTMFPIDPKATSASGVEHENETCFPIDPV